MSQQPLPTLVIPRASTFLRALRAPFLGYAAALATSVLLLLLLLLGTALDGDLESEAGVDEDALEGLRVLGALPFQITAMGLFGRLRFEEDGISVGLFAVPLLVTAVFVVTTGWLANRAERQEPLPGAGERALVAVAAGLGTAVVATLLTWLISLPAGVHAASFSLCFGAFTLAAGTTYVARTRAAVPAWPLWLQREWRLAGQLWFHHLLLFMGCMLPVAFVWVAVKEGFGAALLLPLWGPTVGLFGYAGGHLGGLNFWSETVMGWQVDGLLFALLLLLAVVASVVASVTWLVRRNVHPEWLATPSSWFPLPTAFLVGGLLVWLLPTLRLSGGLEEFGASLTLQPAPWVFLVLATWGALIELSSRHVAPTLATRTPARVRDLMARPARMPAAPATPAGEHVPVVARRPMTPEESRRVKRLAIGVGAGAVLLGVAWLAVTIVNAQAFGPESAAEDYLDAVTDADLERALRLAPISDDAEDSLLVPQVYKAVEDRVSGYEITDVEKEGDTATLTVELEGVEGDNQVELTMEKDGKTGVLFDQWKVSEGGAAGQVWLSPGDNRTVAVNGVDVDLPDNSYSPYWAFPGTYFFAPSSDSPWLTADEAMSTRVSADPDDSAQAEIPRLVASEEFIDTVNGKLTEWLEGCMASKSLEPEGCPQSAFAFGETPRKVVWSLVTTPTLSFDGFDGTFPVELYAEEEGKATATYEADQSYGFGPRDWVKGSDESTLYIGANVSEVDGELLVEFDD